MDLLAVHAELELLGSREVEWVREFCIRMTRHSGRYVKEEIASHANAMDVDRRKGLLVAAIAEAHANDGKSHKGYFGHASPGSVILQVLNRLNFDWSTDQALWLAAQAAGNSAELGVAVPTIYDTAARALARLDIDELVAARTLVLALRRKADSSWSMDLENLRTAAVHRMKQIVYRADLGPTDHLPNYAFEWRDTFGAAARAALEHLTSIDEVARSVELLSLRGSSARPTKTWANLILTSLPANGLHVARIAVETALSLPDDDDVFNPEGAPAFLGPESLVQLRGAVVVILDQGDPSDHRTLRELAEKCRQPVPDGWGHKRAPALAGDITKGLQTPPQERSERRNSPAPQRRLK